jgi:hypothetical protein
MPSQTANFTLTESERALLPTDEDVRFYSEHGWYLSRRLLSDEDVDQLHAASERYYAGHRDRTLPRRPPKLADWTPERGDVQRQNDYVHHDDDTVAAIICRPLIGAVAARLAGASEIRVFQSTLIFKPPRPDEPTNLVPWHFDKDYWATSSSERMLTAFIPFHDCDEDMGTITMIDGTHRWKEADDNDITALHFAHRDTDDLADRLRRNAHHNNAQMVRVPIRIPRGHMSFHHCRTYHGSGPNRSTMPRRAISLHLQDGENAYREFRLPDGSAATYNHDALVRRLPDGRFDYADPTYCPVIWRDSTP